MCHWSRNPTVVWGFCLQVAQDPEPLCFLFLAALPSEDICSLQDVYESTKALRWFHGGSAQLCSCAVGCCFSSVCITHHVSHLNHSYSHQHLPKSSDLAPVRSLGGSAAFVGKQGQHITISNLKAGMKQSAKY